MAVTFSADEIFELAELIEQNGARFYRKAAKGFSNTEVKRLFEELVDMELDHEKTFAAMRAELTSREREPSVFDPNDEVGMYLQAMADGKVFDTKTDPSEQLTQMETPEDILNKAIGFEKDSIVFFLGLEYYVPAREGRDKVREILSKNGVATGIHYPTPLPFLKAYSHLGYNLKDFPVAYSIKDEILSLPIHGEMTDTQVNYVIEQLNSALKRV